jgi:hypothetical protein
MSEIMLSLNGASVKHRFFAAQKENGAGEAPAPSQFSALEKAQ